MERFQTSRYSIRNGECSHKERVHTEESIPEGKTYRLHDDSFKISGTGEALVDFNDLLRVQLKNDNVQGFDTKLDEVLSP